MRKRYGARGVGGYLAGAVVARTGDDMAGPALLLAGLAATGSSAAAAFVLAGLTVSAAVGGPLFGVLLDRSPAPGRLLCGALALYGAGLAVTLAALGAGLPVPVPVAVAVVAGLFGPALSAGWSSQLAYVADPVMLRRAHAWDAMTFDVAGLAGPALAAVCAALLGAPAAVVVSVGLVGAALPVAWRMPRRARPERPASASMGKAGWVAGAGAIRRSRSLTRATVISVASCVAQGMLVACSPVLGERAFGDAGNGVLLLSGVAAAALAANALLARRGPPLAMAPDTVVRCSVLVQGAALLVAATGHPVFVVAAALAVGAAEGPQLTALFAVRHREAPEELRARVFTLGAGLKITAFALGAALAGPLAARSLSGALLAASLCALAAGLLAGRRAPF